MDFELNDEQRLLRDTVRDFARNEVAPRAAELDRTKAFPYELVEQMGGLGLMGIPFPIEYGGGGADNLSYALAVEELARVDSSVGKWCSRSHWAACGAISFCAKSRTVCRNCSCSGESSKLMAAW
jgi:alkylation response protein AidB-like acyl-CoA dehydrogenase